MNAKMNHTGSFEFVGVIQVNSISEQKPGLKSRHLEEKNYCVIKGV